GTSFQAMQAKLAEVVRLMAEEPAVADVMGFTGGGGGSTSNTARLFIGLVPLAQRKVRADEVIARLRRRLARLPATPVFLQAVQDVRVGGRASNAQYQYTLKGEDLAALERWAPRVTERLRALPSIVDLTSDQQDRGRESRLV